MAKSVDALDLGSSAARHAGSIPVRGTIENSRCMTVRIDGIKNKPLRGDARNIETGRDKLSATLG